MKKRWAIPVVLLLMVLAVAGGVAWYFLTSPQYSLMQVKKAVEQRDAAAFEKYVDLEGIIRRAGNQLSGQWSASFAKELGGLGGVEPEMVNGLVAAFGSAMIEPTVKQIREAALSFIETGRSAPIQVIPGDAVDIAGEVALGALPAVERRGKMATIDLELLTKGETVHARLFMRNLGSHWQIAEIDQVPQTAQAVLTAYATGERKRIEREQAEHPDEAVALPDLAQGAKPLILSYIPSGKFMMGSPDNEENRAKHEGPRHRVHITQPFWMGKYEVTNAQFEVFVKETGYVTTAEKAGNSFGWDGQAQKWTADVKGLSWREPGFPGSSEGKGADQPVVQVSWDDARAYCDWLSEKTGQKFGLPTEAQWEYACRAGSTSMYPWGDGQNGACQYANVWNQENKGKWSLKADGFPCSDGYLFPAPTGSFRANAFGLHDMIGNVWEWCADWYGETYYAEAPKEDPTGPVSEAKYRVLRGGSWGCLPEYCRSANRLDFTPDVRDDRRGFRVVRTP